MPEQSQEYSETQILLCDLVEYVSHMVLLGEKAVFALSEYRQLTYHEAALKNLIGVRHDLSDEDGLIWLSIDRLKRIEPPAIPEDIQSWITVAADPFIPPVVVTVIAETIPKERADQLIEEGILQREDVQPAMQPEDSGNEESQTGLRDVIFRLPHLLDVEFAVHTYVEGPWREWAETEKPRRKTIKIYDDFFGLQQTIQALDWEQGLELVWGMGMVRWQLEDGRIVDHPLVEQLVEIDIDTLSGRINIRPRVTEPNVHLKAFFAIENTGVDQVNSFAKNFFANFDVDDDLSPFNGGTFEPILREVAIRMDGEARYHPDDLLDVTDRTLPPIDKTLRVTNTWVLFGRRRSDNYYIKDLEKLKEAVEKTEDLPGPAKRLVTQPSSTSLYKSTKFNIGQGGSPVGNGAGGGNATISTSPVPEIEATRTEEFFFPKPYNEDQVSIIRRLDENDGVVVQGPPGTGKTHTIANIICHYLATGRRVLVTSKGEAALTVLRDHIPEGIRNLTISLLTNERAGLKQLEQAVTMLSNTATQINPNRLERKIKADQEHIGVLQKSINDIDQELGTWANRHLKTLGEGRSILPMELAQKIASGRESHEWLPDHLGSEKKYYPRFSDEDIAAAREARKVLGENLLYLSKVLPSVADFPDAAKITAVHEDLVNEKRLSEDAANYNVPVLSLSTPRATERAKGLLDAIVRVVAMFKNLESEPWLQRITETWRDKGVGADEVKLFNELLPAARDLANRRRDIVGYAVALPHGADGDDDLFDAVTRAANGTRPFGLVPFGKSRTRAQYDRIHLAGHDPTGVKEWKMVIKTLQWRREMIALANRWNAVAIEHSLPAMEGDLDEIGRWLSNVVSIVNQVTLVLEKDRVTIDKEVPDLFPYGMSATGILSSLQEAEKAEKIIQVNLSKNRLRGSRDKLDELREHLATCSGPIVDSLTEFVDNSVGEYALHPHEITTGWQDLCRNLSDILDLRPQMATVDRVAELVAKSGAQNWASELKKEPVHGGKDIWTPSDWRETWNWRRQEAYLNQINVRDRIRELSETRLRHEDDLRKTFHRVVENRTFLSLKKSMTERVESALVMFTSAIRRIGRGTGIRAQRFRRDARSAMEQSYTAVPCWIMPTWRISESLPPALASFDLVIVDEASQSDIGALPALLRGKRVLVVGDDKQVSPTAAFVEEKRLLQLKHNFLKGQPFGPLMLPGGSLYDLANAMFPGHRIMLKEHFRCVEPIIRFSMQFYSETIVPLRIPKSSERLDPPLIDVYVPHGRKSKAQINFAEAEAIIDEIQKIVSDPAYERRSMGVVSLIGTKQAHHIQTQLLSRIGEEAYVEHDIACGNPATFQGKERDIMFISMVECPESQQAKTALLWEQRFNVALSRARDRMYLFRSVEADKLKPDDLKARTIRHFKSPMSTVATDVGDLIELCDSEFERAVFRCLRGKNYRVEPQVGVGGYFIDMVVHGAHDRRLAVELDGDKAHPPDQWMDDLVRQRNLERMGWRFWRCWGSSYYLDPDSCIDDLVRTLDSLGIEPLGSEEAQRNVYTEHRVVESPKPEVSKTNVAEDEVQQIVPLDDSSVRMVETIGSHYDLRAADLFSLESVEEEQSTLAPSILTSEVDTESEAIEVGDSILIVHNDEPNRQYTYRISTTENDPDMGIIGIDRPLADALLGAEIDEERDIPVEGGKRITVVGIEKNTSKRKLQEPATRVPVDRAVTEVFESEGNAGKPLAAQSESSEKPHIVPHASDTHTHIHTQRYQAWNQRFLPDPREEPLNKIADRLIEIIEAEGPILLHRVFRLHAEAAGIKRIGNQLRSLFLRATNSAIKSGRIVTEGGDEVKKIGLETVVRSAGSSLVFLRTRGPRIFEEIPPSEIKEAMRSFFRTGSNIDEETFYRKILNNFDLKRLTLKVRNSLTRFASEEGLKLIGSNDSRTGTSTYLAKPAPNSSKKYVFEILGESYSVDTLADMLVLVLRTMHDLDSSFLPRLDQEIGRDRPILARNPKELYPGQSDLSHCAREVADSWYVGTNHSKRDVLRILGHICEFTGLIMGDDLRIPDFEDVK